MPPIHHSAPRPTLAERVLITIAAAQLVTELVHVLLVLRGH